MNAWEKAANRPGGPTSGVASCPITRGIPTTMLADTFERLCCRHRQEVPSYCADVCHGKVLPGNLTLIDRRDLEKTFQPINKENTMPKGKQEAPAAAVKTPDRDTVGEVEKLHKQIYAIVDCLREDYGATDEEINLLLAV